MRRFLKWGLYVAVLAGLFTGAFGYFFFAGLGRTFEKESRTAPDFNGKSLAEAESIARVRGLKIFIGERRTSLEIPAGTVIGQQPAAGTPTRAIRQMMLVVSAGKALVSLPAFAGLPQRDVESRLQTLNLKSGQLSYLYSNLNSGKIVSQSPPAGSRLAEGEHVNLLIGKPLPPARYVMPELRGKNAGTVHDFFSARGFQVLLEGPAIGVVRRQFPLTGSPLTTGTQVRIEAAVIDLSDISG